VKIQVEKLTSEQAAKRGIPSWPVWTKEVSRFDYTYDENESCYFLEGQVTVETADGKVYIQPGDFVTFPRGLACVWDIRQPVKKHYRFF
jgi:uncharacterized cupin superfamily protein